MKITLADIRVKQQHVADLKLIRDKAYQEYWRLVGLTTKANETKDATEREYEQAESDLKKLGQTFALDLSEIAVTPRIQEKK